jgi:cytochrome c oxidase subunit II
VNSVAILIAVLYAIVSVIGVLVFVVLARSTTKGGEVDEKKLAHREKAWLFVVIAGLLVLLFGTIFFTPYGQTAPAGAQVVNVDGRQFAFVIEPREVQAGEPVEFLLTASDVNHGFGLYTEDNEFVFQAQMVPDTVTRVVHTFDDPGTYKVLCLEFCGLNHHGMVGQIEVVP